MNNAFYSSGSELKPILLALSKIDMIYERKKNFAVFSKINYIDYNLRTLLSNTFRCSFLRRI